MPHFHLNILNGTFSLAGYCIRYVIQCLLNKVSNKCLISAPIRVEISRTVSSFVSNKSYNVTCQVLGSNPPPDTSLWIGDKSLDIVTKTESSDGKIFTIVGTFTPSPQDNNKFISCRAYNRYVPEETLEDQWKISVLFPPVANLSVNNIIGLLHFLFLKQSKTIKA